MSLSLWRVVKEKHASTAFDGEGARRFGGRWNDRGSAVVYLGGTLSLAVLETFVHLTAADYQWAFVAIEVMVPDEVRIAELEFSRLPENWRAQPPPPETKAIGSAWVRDRETLLLRVPSVPLNIVPREANYLLNPNHPELSLLEIGPPQKFGLDERMWT